MENLVHLDQSEQESFVKNLFPKIQLLLRPEGPLVFSLGEMIKEEDMEVKSDV